MKKQLFCGLFALATTFFAFAGDAAAFVDVGFSTDGKTYVFGEYGKTDRYFQAYAELYAVNVEKNDYVSGEVFRTKPSSETSGFSGQEIYDALSRRAEWKLSKYACTPVAPENILYVREDETKDATAEISFKDFEGSTAENEIFYYVRLIPFYEGKGQNSHSSFFISLEKKDSNGKVLSKNIVGSPDIKRKGVVEYKISRIVSDVSGHSIVFVIEKTVADESGSSIRYMVETIRL